MTEFISFRHGIESVHIDLTKGKNAIMTIERGQSVIVQEIDDLFVQMLLPLRQQLMLTNSVETTISAIKLLKCLYWAYSMSDTSKRSLEFAVFMINLVSGWSGIDNSNLIASGMIAQLKAFAFNNSIGMLYTESYELYCVNSSNVLDTSVIAFHSNGDTVRYDFGPGSNGVWHHFIVPLFASAKSFDGTIKYLSIISNLAQTHDVKGVKTAYETSPDKNKSLWQYVMAHEYNNKIFVDNNMHDKYSENSDAIIAYNRGNN